MAQFRQMGLAGDYFLAFNLKVLPRRGESTTIPGRMWGARFSAGPVTRVALVEPESATESERYLAHNGENAQAWRLTEFSDEARSELLTAETLLDPIAGTGLSMFELQMPFIYWSDFVYEGTTEVRGRAVHAFLMFPPEEFAATHPDIGGVRLHLDANFHALMQAVVLDELEEPVRKLTVLDLKKLGSQWIVKSIDVRDEQTRDKVRFEVTGAALDLEFSPQLFSPESLAVTVEPPASVEPLRWWGL
ncbi:MAG: hypothetical protein SynsKO_17520 [Synoicihabitans sp.]